MVTLRKKTLALTAKLKEIAKDEPDKLGVQAAELFFQALAADGEVTAKALPQALRKAAPGTRPARAWAAYLETILATEQYRWDRAEKRALVALRWADDAVLRGRILNELGILSDQLGRWQEAISYYRSALALFEKEEDHVYIAKVAKNLGTALTRGVEAGDLPHQALGEAEALERRALAIFSQAKLAGLEAATWNELGTVLKARGHGAEAQTCYQHYLAFCQQEEYAWGQGQALNNIAEIVFAQENYRQAVSLWQQALALVQGHIWDEIDILSHLAPAFRRLGDGVAAQQWSQAALARIESVRARLQAAQTRTDFFAVHQQPYRVAAGIALAQGDKAQVLTLAERAKARTFADLLAGQKGRKQVGQLSAWQREERKIRRQLQASYQREEPDEGQEALETAWLALQRRIARADVDLGLIEAEEPLTAEMIQAHLPADTALLLYFESDEELLALLVRHDSILIQPLGINLKQIAPATFDRHGRPRGLMREDGRLGEPWLLARLGALLLQPLADSLAGVKRLWLIPHGLLHHLPFAALPVTHSGQMLEQLVPEVAQTPSATILWRFLQKRPCPGRGGLFLGYNGGRLRHAGQEARLLAQQVGGVALVDDEATATALEAHALAGGTLHFACPGIFRPDQPLRSGLLLADGHLDVAQIYASLRLSAGLVTLSACETGRGHLQGGDEIVGLVRAWLYAGSAAVLVSLWQVDDLANLLLMRTFYHHLPTEGAPTALRRAQQTLRTLTRAEIEAQCREMGSTPAQIKADIARMTQMWGGRLPARPLDHPYFWAAFVLHGGMV